MPDSPATWSDYHDAVARYVAAIDGVLERGRARERAYEAFLRQRGIEPGSGARKLENAALAPGQRHVLQRLLELTRSIHVTFGGAAPSRPAPVPSAAARALANRNRI